MIGPDSNDDSAAEPDRGSIAGTPRWVKVFGIIAVVVVLIFVILLVAGGGQHGPGRHTRSDGGHTPLVQYP
ncbi:MAG TPA: hypothetical protein VK736_08520 [Candidatus Binatia bacterium]|nr:hypothetical protein [Candidatus Binatia bacterium]